jgi:EAL domain-containing protein (putative c-di-GMP-specific phosphodiesterase class I)
MYQAKADGGGRHKVFEKGRGWGGATSDSLGDDLKRALGRDEFRVAYQPIIALPAGRVAGCTAVLQWEHESKGSLSADDFAFAAEQQGLTAELHAWLLQEACSQMKQWLDAGLDPGRLTVEISPAQLRQDGLADNVREALARIGL